MNNFQQQEKINIKPLISARNFLADIVQDARSNYEKAGVVKAFEVCFELVHPILRRILKLRDIKVSASVKEVFRVAYSERLIDNVEVWIQFKDWRDDTSHSYDGRIAIDIIDSLPGFVNELNLLLENLLKMPEIQA